MRTNHKVKKIEAVLCSVLFIVPALFGSAGIDDFNFEWKFAKGAHPESMAPDFNDSEWERVDLPHDWAISGPFGDVKEEGHTGKLPWKGEGVYRKHFTLPKGAEGRRLQFIFDGVMASPKVYLNGTEVGSWIYGYNSFWIDATDAALFGEDNVLVVHADTHEHGSRWYPGAGIYRKVSARLVEPIHIPVWGVVVTTPEVAAGHASVDMQVEVVNKTARKQTVSIETIISDPTGKPVARTQQRHAIPTGELVSVPLQFAIQNPLRWDVETPQLYTATTRLLIKGTEIQQQETTFGVREFKWTADDGFQLNGRRVQLNGVNLHHDQGPLGAAFFPRAMERQLEMMKEMGVNAIRTSHNPSAPELLELCDRMGFVVWDELFDKYGTTAGVDCGIDEYVNQYAEREVENFMRRDRNHPCIVIWSIGNEIGNLEEKHVDQMVGYFKEWDTSRPVALGSHIPWQAHHVINSLDASGWNYAQKYMTARKAKPDMPLIYSESASTFGTRGAYKLSTPRSKTDWGGDGQINAHMLTAATWSDIPELELERMLKHSFVAGEFVWTGYDYLGEPTPFKRARSSYFGIVDLAGLPKDSFYLYRSHWRPEATTLHLAPHWNWAGDEGENVPVIVYTNGDEAELFLNGKSLGRKRKARPEEVISANLAFGKITSASSEELKQDALGNVQTENLTGKAVDGNSETRWCADSGNYPQHWQVDLEKVQTISQVVIQWEKQSDGYDFDLLVSLDGKQWDCVDAKVKSHNNISELEFKSSKVRWVRVDIKSGAGWASLTEVTVLEKAAAVVDPYYQMVDAYRLRWMNVPYEPGELTAVAYKNGERIGEVSNKTAGKATRLKLKPDRTRLKADGMDLCYVEIEMVDKNGTLCPLAMDQLSFSVDGAAQLAGVANGDPMGHDSFTDVTHPLFFGKAVAVLRGIPRKSGKVVLNVRTDGGMESEATVFFGSLDVEVLISDHGAVGDDKTLNTTAIQAAIDQVESGGGGTVVVPEGIFVSGALFLKPGVNLRIEKGGVLRCSTDMANFPEQRTRIEGHFEEQFNPALINADGCDGLVISGEGTLDGAGKPIWDLFWKLRDGDTEFKNLDVPRARLCIIENSSNVTVKGITFKDAQFWNLHLYKCRGITVENARFTVPDNDQPPSSDGVDVDSCQEVTVKGCWFSVNDDCIALKGTKGPFALEDKTSPPVEHIRISDCVFMRGHGVVTCGSEATIVRDVIVENCEVSGAMPLVRLKLRPDTPQRYEDFVFRNITIDSDNATLFQIKKWTQYFDPKGQPEPASRVRNIKVSGITGSIGSLGVIQGNKMTEIRDIILEDVDVQAKRATLDASNIVQNLKIESVTVNGDAFSQGL